ncbi:MULTISPECIES: hypothetical protein [Aphanothece]|uniref:hypothetical protein n=1 Tax=Aphanothece TaxID=1121 RepID=UPI0039854129
MSRGTGTPERRRTSRQDGQVLLFAAAQDIARQQGKLSDGLRASLEQSVLSRTSLALKTSEGKLIARVALPEARRMLAYRRQVARELLQLSKAEVTRPGRPPEVDKQTLRMQEEKVRALAWAIGSGRRFPYMGSRRRHTLITVLLLLCGVLPGIVYLIWLWRRSEEYGKLLDQLLSRWRALGRPDPALNFFTLYNL